MTSISRQIRRGTLVSKWNESTESYDWFRRTARGGFVLTNPFVKGSTLGPTLHRKQIEAKPDHDTRNMLQKSIDKVKNLFK